MGIWQVDFYRHPQSNPNTENDWSLLICHPDGMVIHQGQCSPSQATAHWIVEQLQIAQRGELPKIIQTFRPQTLSLLTIAAKTLGIEVEGVRGTTGLKRELQRRFCQPNYDPIQVEQPPPQGLPEKLWGEQWCFAAIPGGELVEAFCDRPIPVLEFPESLFPRNLGLGSHVPIPGIVIYGGRQSLSLARWLQDARPFALKYIAKEEGISGGLVLETGLVDRWILATFEDGEVAQRGTLYQQRQKKSLGLHFLLIQPDDSGMTYSGLWLLKQDIPEHNYEHN